MFKLIITSLLINFSVSVLAADKKEKRHHYAHEHGTGKLNLAIESKSLLVEIEVPAHDIVGFEHYPESDTQKKLVNDAIASLKNVDEIIMLPQSANCVSEKEAVVETEILNEGDHHDKNHKDHKDHKEGKDHHKEGKDHDKHSEFHINYSLTCQNIDKLDQVTVLAFKKFAEMKKIVAQAVTSSGQFSQTLDAKSPVLKLK